MFYGRSQIRLGIVSNGTSLSYGLLTQAMRSLAIRCCRFRFSLACFAERPWQVCHVSPNSPHKDDP